MSEVVALTYRAAQAVLALAIVIALALPALAWVWSFLWPVLVLGGILALFESLDAFAKRVEETSTKQQNIEKTRADLAAQRAELAEQRERLLRAQRQAEAARKTAQRVGARRVR